MSDLKFAVTGRVVEIDSCDLVDREGALRSFMRLRLERMPRQPEGLEAPLDVLVSPFAIGYLQLSVWVGQTLHLTGKQSSLGQSTASLGPRLVASTVRASYPGVEEMLAVIDAVESRLAGDVASRQAAQALLNQLSGSSRGLGGGPP